MDRRNKRSLSSSTSPSQPPRNRRMYDYLIPSGQSDSLLSNTPSSNNNNSNSEMLPPTSDEPTVTQPSNNYNLSDGIATPPPTYDEPTATALSNDTLSPQDSIMAQSLNTTTSNQNETKEDKFLADAIDLVTEVKILKENAKEMEEKFERRIAALEKKNRKCDKCGVVHVDDNVKLFSPQCIKKL